jgi:hypothetical protein
MDEGPQRGDSIVGYETRKKETAHSPWRKKKKKNKGQYVFPSFFLATTQSRKNQMRGTETKNRWV